MRIPMTCRLCGMEFTAHRFDAKTCSSTCRQRLRRGGDLAYLSTLGKRQQRLQREVHETYDAWIIAYKASVAATQKVREEKRKLKQLKAAPKAERFFNEVIGAAYRKVEREQAMTAALRIVAAYLKLFVKQRRNDFSTEAITAAIDNPEHYPFELVADALAKLKADGDYSRILAE
jgi:hypothetical protein